MNLGWRHLTEDEIDLLIALSGYDTTRSQHFALYAPTFVTNNVKTATLNALQEARTKLLAMGLPFQASSSWYPIEATALRFNDQPNTIAAYVPRPPRVRAHSDPSAASVICLNVDRMVQAEIPNLRAQCGREAVLFVPQAAFGLAGYEKFTTPDAYWLHTALGSWFEERMTDDPTHVPSEFAGNELQPLQGILAGAGQTASSSRKHGMGLSALMKFLITRYNESMVWRVYQELSGGLQHVNALLNSMADPPSAWYPDFLREYLSGQIYGVSAQTFLGNAHGTARIQSAKDTLFLYQLSYPDLSARLFVVDLAFPDIDEKASLRITLTPSEILGNHGSLMVFGVQNGTLVSWTEGQDITIEKLKDLTAAGTKILIAAVNSSSDMPYDAPLGADLRLRVVVPGYRHLYFKLFMGANYRVRDTRTQRDTLWTNLSVSIDEEATGTTTGTVYTADTVLTGTLGGATDTLHATIELDGKRPTLIRKLTVSRWGMRDTTRVGWSVWGHDLPVTSSAPGAFMAEVLGPSVGSHIDSVQYQNWVLDGKYLLRLIDCWGADASAFRVALSEYPLVEKRRVVR
jgi:hypothetical protein